jgi:hypothetical protein
MGQKDLGTCIILSQEDTEKLKINLDEFKFVGDVKLFPVKGIFDFRIKRKLRKKVERVAKKYGADIAVVYLQFDHEDIIFSEMSYDFNLYKYKE